MLARHSYEHAITLPLISSLFGAGIWLGSGYFIIYLDEGLQSFEKSFTENSRVFEFALSNALLGNTVITLIKRLPTINVMDKSTDITNASGDECRKQMKDDKPPPAFFSVGKSHYVVYAKIRNGKNNCRSWCFVVQKYDANAWSNSLIKRLQRVVP